MEKKYSFAKLDKDALHHIKGGGLIDVLEVVADTTLRISSLTGVFIVAVKNGIKESITQK
jgi:hypothetical protein